MSKLKIIALSVACVGLATGCKSLEQPKPKAGQVRPMTKVQHAGSEAEAKYELGRFYYGQRRAEEARRALEEALALDAAHSRASNVLGVIYASQGRYEEAQAQFKRALEREPQAAYVYSNIGYAYLLQGRDREALESFEQALRFDPQNERAAGNLKIARERLGFEVAPTELTRVVASTIPAPTGSPRADAGGRSSGQEPSKIRMVEIAPNVYELAMPGQVASASRGSIGAPATPTRSSAGTDQTAAAGNEHRLFSEAKTASMLVQVSSNVYELGTPPSIVVASIAPNAIPGATPKSVGLGVEVANGNGIPGMAKQVATALRLQGIGVARLSNRKPFNQPTTEIEYRQGFQTTAEEIGTRLPNLPKLVESGDLGAGINVRLVLGKDVNKELALADPRVSDFTKLALLR